MALRPLLVAGLVARALAGGGDDGPCQSGSVPFFDCDFAPGGHERCLPGVNTGQAADPDNHECDVPSPGNKCMLQVDMHTMAWMWQSSLPGVRCCNCFQTGEVGGVCPENSASEHECFGGGRSRCLKGVNTGQLARPSGYDRCEVPSPQNGCMLKVDPHTMAWFWESPHTECCNCWQLGDDDDDHDDDHGGRRRRDYDNDSRRRRRDDDDHGSDRRRRDYDNDHGSDRRRREFDYTHDGDSFVEAKAFGSDRPAATGVVRKRLRQHADGDVASMLQLPMEQEALEEAEL